VRKGRASFTAIAVAAFRAAATGMERVAINPDDAVALRLLPRAPAAATRLLASAGPILQQGARVASLGLLDHVALRSAKLDGLLGAALASGVEQLVILGAGLDSRTHRELGLGRCLVYEVDHPDSQALKLQRIEGLPVRAARLRHVPVAFGAEPLAPALLAAGFDPTRRSFWIWEGVVMYLPESATRATLGELAALCSPGSQLALSYMVPQQLWLRTLGPLVRAAMRALGEPLLGVTSSARIGAALAEAGLSLLEDTDTHDWAQALGAGSVASRLVAYERIALAQRA
jgi:methyltransferase (TIGR00027 family)